MKDSKRNHVALTILFGACMAFPVATGIAILLAVVLAVFNALNLIAGLIFGFR